MCTEVGYREKKEKNEDLSGFLCVSYLCPSSGVERIKEEKKRAFLSKGSNVEDKRLRYRAVGLARIEERERRRMIACRNTQDTIREATQGRHSRNSLCIDRTRVG